MPNSLAVAAALITLSSCGHARAEDAGQTVQRSYAVGGFDRIEVAGPYDVEVRTGAAPRVGASGPEKMIAQMVVEVRGDRLLIHPRKQTGMFRIGAWSHGKVKLTVTVPQLRAAEIAGSGGIRINEVRGQSFDGQIAGSGNLSVDKLDVASLKLGIAGSGSATARSGHARQVDYSIAGSGDIDGKGVASDTASVSIAGSGNVAARASQTAQVEIMGSGDVDLTGGAKCSISKAGSGTVRCS